MKINDNLKRLRLKKGESQKQTALNTNIAYANYNKYETTDTAPDIDTLIKLADYFHTTVDYLIGHEVPYLLDMSTLSDQKKSLINKIVVTSERLAERTESYLNGLLEAEEEKQQIIQKFKRS